MMLTQINPLEDHGINERCRLIIRDREDDKYVVKKVIEKQESIDLDISHFESHWNYRFKFQVRGKDTKTGEERWIDATSYKMFYPEQQNEEGMKYLLYENPKSEKLVVIFQAINKTPSYNYVGALKDFNVNRLYIKDDYGQDKATKTSYYLGQNKNLDIAEKTQRLIRQVADKLGIKKKDTIFGGSSKGGFASIYHGYLFGAGHIVAGGPQILLGDYLSGGHEESSVGKEIFRSIVGELNEENIEWSNQLIYNTLKKAEEPYPQTHIHVGYWEPHYSRHVEPFVKMAIDLDIYSVELDVANYKSHSELAKHYPKFLKEKIQEIIQK